MIPLKPELVEEAPIEIVQPSKSFEQNESAEEGGPRSECEICGRQFNTDRLDKHMAICQKQQKSRKPFNVAERRHDNLDSDAKRLVHVVDNAGAAAAIDRTARVKADKLNWEVKEPEIAFGTKNASFKPVYEEAPVPPPAKAPAEPS